MARSFELNGNSGDKPIDFLGVTGCDLIRPAEIIAEFESPVGRWNKPRSDFVRDKNGCHFGGGRGFAQFFDARIDFGFFFPLHQATGHIQRQTIDQDELRSAIDLGIKGRQIYLILDGLPFFGAVPTVLFDPLLEIVIAGISRRHKNDFFGQMFGQFLRIGTFAASRAARNIDQHGRYTHVTARPVLAEWKLAAEYALDIHGSDV